jgi:hypothetical protein
MTDIILHKIKLYIQRQLAYGRLLFDTTTEPIKSIYEIKEAATLNKASLQLEEDIKNLAYQKAIMLGFDPTTMDNLECVIWEIQKLEGCEMCFKNREECVEARCCWMKLCFKEE